MDVTAEDQLHSGWLVLTVAGEVDLYTATQLREALNSSVARVQADGEARTLTREAPAEVEDAKARAPGGEATPGDGVGGVVVDLAGVEFMDSAGLGVLIAGMKRATAAGLGYRLAGVDSRLLKLLQITGLVKVLHLYDDVPTAIAA